MVKTFDTPRVCEYYYRLMDLIEKYDKKRSERKEIYEQINQCHKLIELERIKIQSRYNKDSDIDGWISIVCTLCAEKTEKILDRNKNDIEKAKKLIDRILVLTRRHDMEYSKMYCEIPLPSLKAKSRKVIMVGHSQGLKKCSEKTVRSNISVLANEDTSFLVLVSSKAEELIAKPEANLILKGSDYSIYGSIRKDHLGLAIQQVKQYLDEFGYDLYDVTDRELMGMVTPSKSKTYKKETDN